MLSFVWFSWIMIELDSSFNESKNWSQNSHFLVTFAVVLKGHWTNLTIFWKLANNLLYAKIRR